MKTKYSIAVVLLMAGAIAYYSYGRQQARKGNAAFVAKEKTITGSSESNYNGNSYNSFVADLKKQQINIHYKNPATGAPFHQFSAVKRFLDSIHEPPLLITNGGMFTPLYTPLGLYIENSITGNKLDTHEPALVKGNFYLQPNGVFYIDAHGVPHVDTTREFARLQKAGKIHATLATQSGPMLLINGRVNNSFTKGSANLNIRSGVGIIDSTHVVFAISVTPCNFYDFAMMFKVKFHCKNALYLDGSISEMYLKDLHPSLPPENYGAILSVTEKRKGKK